MVKKKSCLRRNIRRSVNHSTNLQKRKFQHSPRKPSPFKVNIISSFKSPAFRPSYKSPATKRFKRLFTPSNTPKKATLRKTKTIDIEDNNDTTTDTISLNEDFGFEPLSDEEHSVFTHHELSQTDQECDMESKLQQLIPGVLQEFRNYKGLDTTFLNFFEQVICKKFPLDNVSFLLWTEVVQWFSRSSTTQMRYSNETKLFWKLGWRIFGKRFVNFMGGFKSHGDTIVKMANAGNYNPDSSEINFAVPDINILREFDPYIVGTERKPGIFHDSISEMTSSIRNKSACITFDGKKLKQGLTEDTGDVDLLGFEKDKTLQERKDSLDLLLKEIDSISKTVHASINQNSEETSGTAEKDMDEQMKQLANEQLKHFLLKQIAIISEHESELEKLRNKKEYSRKKLIEISGQDWKKGKYVYAISAITVYLHDIESYMKMAREISNRTGSYIAAMNNEPFINGKYVNLEYDKRYFSIKENVQFQEGEASTRLITQRTDEWSQLRQQAKVTGSTLYKAIGCDGLGRQKDHFEKVICGIEEKEPTAEIKAAMEWGTKNEVNGVATVVGKVLPVLEPELKFFEEGCVTMHEDGKPFMVVSPDGSLRRSRQFNTTEVAIEIKCPTRNVHTEFPDRYYLQCQAEIIALNVDRLLYVSWTEQDTTVFLLTRDDEIFNRAKRLAIELYCDQKPKKPTKLSDECKKLKDDLKSKSKNVKMIGRFVSCKQQTGYHNVYDQAMNENTSENLTDLMSGIGQCYKDHYELLRQKATEAVVFLLADLDRGWQRDTVRCSPIAWFPKGYSLDSVTMRSIAEEVHTQCTANGIHVPCESFDGQWHTLVVRSAAGEPLTMFQLQKDIWKNVEKMSKTDIIRELKTMNTAVTILNNEEGNESPDKHKRFIATNGGNNLPRYRKVVQRKAVSKASESEKASYGPTLADSVSDTVRGVTGVSADVLAMTEVTDVLELEAFSSNINEEKWGQELEDLLEYIEDVEIVDEHEKSKTGANTVPVQIMNVSDMECVLSLLKTTKDCNKKGQWNNVTSEQLQSYFTSERNLNSFLDCDLRTVVRYLRKSKGLKGIKEYDTKAKKVKGLVSYLGLTEELPSVERKVKKSKKVKPLKELSLKLVSKYSKFELNVCIAEYKWPQAYKSWKLPIEDVVVNDEEKEWFYKPEYSLPRKQLEVKCVDSTHLLTRMRRKSCRGGLDLISNESWLKVARQKRTLLTPIMVEDITDPMAVSMAETHFSEPVETAMRKNGDKTAADLCKDIRMWWQAEDKCAIGAAERIKMREPLRQRLLSRANFSRFPPATQYLSGWPQQLWEACIANIDAKSYMYGLAHGGTYNVRAFSSLIGETFFSELVLNDRRGQGTVTAKEFGQFISRATEQVQIRLDPERTFSYCTSKRTVYRTVDEACVDTEHTEAKQDNTDVGHILKHIWTRDHEFDKADRKRLTGRKKADHIATDRNAVQRGTLGVRWEKARLDYSKMLPTKRMGLDD